MGRMRVLLAIALLGFGSAGVTAASAAELPIDHSGSYSAGYFEDARHSAMLWSYDDQPGVGVRAYWRAPWRHHHYFPATGAPPDIGRDEDLSAVGEPPKPAKTFRRTWSNASVIEHERRVRVRPLADRPMPRKDLPPPNPELN
jgi:hypothetical protein